MKIVQIKEGFYYFKSPVNVGYVHKDNTGLLIDAGLDQSAMNKIIRQLKERNLPLTHLFITHGHADHYGGGASLQTKKQILTIAPLFEEAILRYPKLEPVYLFHGVNPPIEMRNKFLEGKSLRVDEVVSEGQYQWGDLSVELIPLPGHSENQLGVKVGNILYAADGYMSLDTLKKHKIPFLIDFEQTIHSLEYLLSIDAEGALPGHGEFEVDFKVTVRNNIDFYHTLINQLENHLEKTFPSGGTVEEIVAQVCDHWGIRLEQLAIWSLNRTAITAYLIGILNRHEKSLNVKRGQLWFEH